MRSLAHSAGRSCRRWRIRIAVTQQARGEDVLARSALALQLAEPRTRAAVGVGAQTNVVDDVAAVDGKVMAFGVD
jgi:hypothetical protein